MKVGLAVLCAALLAPLSTGFVVRPSALARNTLASSTPLQLPSTIENESDKESTESATKSTPSSDDPVFQNEGLFAWMKPFMKAMGFVEGNVLYGGVPMAANGAEGTSADTDAINAEKYTITDMQNIGIAERIRRDKIGEFLLAISALYATWATLVADDGGFTGHALRAGVLLPFFFAAGYKRSAEEGL